MSDFSLNRDFRDHFPFFRQSPDWTYLDSAATTLKPQILIDETVAFYCSAGSVHRSQYDVAQTAAYENARERVAARFNVPSDYHVVWTSGTTQSINLVALGMIGQIQAGDEIIISVAEHHANFIPWQQLALQCQAKLIVLPVDSQFQLDLASLRQALSTKTKIVALNLVSNVTGIRQPVEQIIPLIRQYSRAKILLDMAQAVCTEKVDTQAIGADFYVFSAHKLYGPTGVGGLIGQEKALADLQVTHFGGKMLKGVDHTQLILAELPYRLEAGTPNIAGIIAFGQVLAWLENWDLDRLNNGVYQLGERVRKRLENDENVQIFVGESAQSTFSFQVRNEHHADIAAMLTEQKIAIRSGEHCAKPYLAYLQQQGTLRISLAHYNQPEDIERFFQALELSLSILAT